MRRHSGHQRLYAKRSSILDEKYLKQQHNTAETAPENGLTGSIPTLNISTIQRAKTSPQKLTSQEILQLQATMGNRALARMINAPMMQGTPAPLMQHSTPMASSTIQRHQVLLITSSGSRNTIRRWWPFGRRNETDQQRLERYTRKVDNINMAIDILRVGHGVVMLPLTLIDLISNIARPFTGNKVHPKQGGISKRDENRKVFHNAINGETKLVALMGGNNGRFDLGVLKYMPWNILPWIIGALSRWATRLNKKRTTLSQRIKGVDTNQAGGNKAL